MARPVPKGPVRRVDSQVFAALVKAPSSDIMVSGAEAEQGSGERGDHVANQPLAQSPLDAAPGSEDTAKQASGNAQKDGPATSEAAEDPQGTGDAMGEGRVEAQAGDDPPPPQDKITFTMDRADAQRARSTFLRLPYEAKPDTWSDFIADAIVSAVQQLEREYNDGEPYPPVEGRLRRGRPPKLT